MLSRQGYQQSILIEGQAYGVGWNGVTDHKGDIQPALLQRRRQIAIVHLRYRQHDMSMSSPPVAQEAGNRFPNHVLTRDQLLDLARGRTGTAFDRSIDVHVSRLRHRIEVDPKNPELIKTVRTGGYVFTAPVTLNGEAW